MSTILGPRKPLEEQEAAREGQGENRKLRKTLSWPHLIALGVGAIVGTGIYTLTGVGADRAGPAVILAFTVAGVVCACAALAYAELATMIPTAGSAYTYTYSVMGETLAWIVGWSLILEYSLACSTVAVGWSAYLVGWLQSAGIELPHVLLVGPHAGGIINLPAVIVALTIEAVGEALLFAARAGADPAKVRQALMGGFASSRILEVHGERMVKRTFEPGFRIELHQKDLNLALASARTLGVSLPNTATAQELFNACAAHGGKGWDHSAMVRALEMLANFEIGQRAA